jgi:hypothetical protein
MALEAAATFELRWLIAKSRRRHETFQQTIADAILLASQQVQDTRLDLLERGPELSVSALFIDFLIAVSFNIGGPVIKEGLTNIIASFVAQRLKTFAAKPGKVIEIVTLKQLTPERIANVRKGLVARVQKYEVPGGDPKSAPEEWRLFRELSKETVGFGLEKGKEALKTEPKQTAPPGKEGGGDTPGVALMDTVLSFVREEQSAIDSSHDLDDFWVVSGLLSDAQAKSLTDFYSKEEKLEDGRDLSLLKEKLKLFFEACIWANLFSARLWHQWRKEPHPLGARTSSPFPFTAVELGPEAPKKLQEYWVERFDSVVKSANITAPNEPEPLGAMFRRPIADRRIPKLRDFFRSIDGMLKTPQDVARLIQPPSAAKTKP